MRTIVLICSAALLGASCAYERLSPEERMEREEITWRAENLEAAAKEMRLTAHGECLAHAREAYSYAGKAKDFRANDEEPSVRSIQLTMHELRMVNCARVY